MGNRLIEVLSRDPELAQGMSTTQQRAAQRDCVARLLRVSQKTLQPRQFAAGSSGGFGLLLLSGFLVRRVNQGGRFGAELLGPGDLLRPWRTVGYQASMPFEPAWTAVSDAELAILDDTFARLAAPYPAVAVQLVDRAMLRSRHLVINMAIVRQPRIDTRLHMLFWHLADRWGRTGSAGVTLNVPLTHGLLSDLVAARRPTVSSAISSLGREGKVLRTDEGWLLPGRPPGELVELAGVAADGPRPDSGEASGRNRLHAM